MMATFNMYKGNLPLNTRCWGYKTGVGCHHYPMKLQRSLGGQYYAGLNDQGSDPAGQFFYSCSFLIYLVIQVVLVHVGVTSLIAHIRVGRLQAALEAQTMVLPAVGMAQIC